MSTASNATLARQIRDRCRLSGSFQLRSGAVSDTYFDKYLFESDPQLLASVCRAMVDLIPQETNVLAGLEMGGIPIVTMLSQLTGIPAAFIRKEAKSYGTCKYAEGPDLRGQHITLIEDVVSSGGALRDAIRKLNADGIHPVGVLCVIDRQSGGAQHLADDGFTLHSVLTMQDIEQAG